jgi:hypothetical protein
MFYNSAQTVTLLYYALGERGSNSGGGNNSSVIQEFSDSPPSLQAKLTAISSQFITISLSHDAIQCWVTDNVAK